MVSLESLGKILWICGLGSYVQCIAYAGNISMFPQSLSSDYF